MDAALRALDRSGKPCRRWVKGSLQLKSFTGVAWELPRWVRPPRADEVQLDADEVQSDAGESAPYDTGKENMETE